MIHHQVRAGPESRPERSIQEPLSHSVRRGNLRSDDKGLSCCTPSLCTKVTLNKCSQGLRFICMHALVSPLMLRPTEVIQLPSSLSGSPFALALSVLSLDSFSLHLTDIFLASLRHTMCCKSLSTVMQSSYNNNK